MSSNGSLGLDDLPASVEVIDQLKPVYENIIDAPIAEDAPLPDWAIALIQLISTEVTEVVAVCVGKRRDQVLWL